jgi:putative addiction module component (TIGR02574 family)
MPDTVSDLAARAHELDPKDRERLVDLLLGDLDQHRDAAAEEAWRQEIRRRISAYESGEAVLHDADQVIAEVRRIIS